jgi:hypothetical protein
VIRYLTAPLRAQHAKIYVIDQVNALPVSFLLDEVKNRGPSMVGLDESLYESFEELALAGKWAAATTALVLRLVHEFREQAAQFDSPPVVVVERPIRDYLRAANAIDELVQIGQAFPSSVRARQASFDSREDAHVRIVQEDAAGRLLIVHPHHLAYDGKVRRQRSDLSPSCWPHHARRGGTPADRPAGFDSLTPALPDPFDHEEAEIYSFPGSEVSTDEADEAADIELREIISRHTMARTYNPNNPNNPNIPNIPNIPNEPHSSNDPNNPVIPYNPHNPNNNNNRAVMLDPKVLKAPGRSRKVPIDIHLRNTAQSIINRRI